MDASRQTTPHHPPPKMDVLTKTLLQIIHAAGYSAAFKYVTPNSSDDLCLLFCLFLLVWKYITINSAIYKRKSVACTELGYQKGPSVCTVQQLMMPVQQPPSPVVSAQLVVSLAKAAIRRGSSSPLRWRCKTIQVLLS